MVRRYSFWNHGFILHITLPVALHMYPSVQCCGLQYWDLPLAHLLSSFGMTPAYHHLLLATYLCWWFWSNVFLPTGITILQMLPLLIVMFAHLRPSAYMIPAFHCLLMVTTWYRRCSLVYCHPSWWNLASTTNFWLWNSVRIYRLCGKMQPVL